MRTFKSNCHRIWINNLFCYLHLGLREYNISCTQAHFLHKNKSKQIKINIYAVNIAYSTNLYFIFQFLDTRTGYSALALYWVNAVDHTHCHEEGQDKCKRERDVLHRLWELSNVNTCIVIGSKVLRKLWVWGKRKDIKPIPPFHVFGELLNLAEPPNKHDTTHDCLLLAWYSQLCVLAQERSNRIFQTSKYFLSGIAKINFHFRKFALNLVRSTQWNGR